MDKIKEEQEYLDYTKVSLCNEIDYRKNELKEIPKRYSNKLQGDAFLAEGLMTMNATKLRKLQLAEKSPYFGRFDFVKSNSEKPLKVYIGKTNVMGKNNEQVVTDWRAPICNLYYDSNLGKASYYAPDGNIEGELKLKRQIIIKDGQLIDVLDTDLANNDELLRPYLCVNADNKMKTIIESIQKEQNEIIRKPISKNIIVQGVAGSGKTSVALHRIAFLVYDLQNKNNSHDFLVLGPNKHFLNYIANILPELETEPVEQKTFLDLVNSVTNENIKLKLSEDLKNIDSKGSENFISNYKVSLNYKTTLKNYMDYYLKNVIVSKGIKIDGQEVFSKEDIKRVLLLGDDNKPDFNRARDFFIRDYKNNLEQIDLKLNEKYRKIYLSLPKGDPRRDEAVKKSIELGRLIKCKGVKIIRDYFKKIELNVIDIYKLFIQDIEKHDFFLSESQIKQIQKETLMSIKQKKFSFEDLPALLYIHNYLYGQNKQYKHIVIDEAQDYGLFHFDILKEMNPNCTFSIYGDLGQSIYSFRSIEDWQCVSSNIFNNNCELLNLSRSYRTTIEITNNANKILDKMNLLKASPVIRHGENILFSNSSKDTNYKLEKILEWKNKGYKSIAVICKNDKEASSVYEELKKHGLDIKLINQENMAYEGQIFVMSSSLSKGLEFDAVMINDASNNVYLSSCKNDMHLLYVACTRALHELNILYNNNLCDVFDFSNSKNKENSAKIKVKNIK